MVMENETGPRRRDIHIVEEQIDRAGSGMRGDNRDIGDGVKFCYHFVLLFDMELMS